MTRFDNSKYSQKDIRKIIRQIVNDEITEL